MRELDNEGASALSGLSRGQIDQLISRWGVGIYGTRGRSNARYFNKTDLFNLMLAGALSRLGMSMPMIRDVLLGGLGLYEWDRERDRPAEIYPGQNAAGPGKHNILLYQWEGHWYAKVVNVEAGDNPRVPRGTVALAIDASGLVERIEEAVGGGPIH